MDYVSIPTQVCAIFKLPIFLKLTNTDPVAAWFVVTGDATVGGIRVVRSVLGSIDSLPIGAFRSSSVSKMALDYVSIPTQMCAPPLWGWALGSGGLAFGIVQRKNSGSGFRVWEGRVLGLWIWHRFKVGAWGVALDYVSIPTQMCISNDELERQAVGTGVPRSAETAPP